MAFDATGDFNNLAATLTAPQYGQVNPNLSMAQGKNARAMALTNAMNALKSGDIRLQGREEDLANQERMAQLNNQKAGPLDFLSGGLGVADIFKNIASKPKPKYGPGF